MVVIEVKDRVVPSAYGNELCDILHWTPKHHICDVQELILQAPSEHNLPYLT